MYRETHLILDGLSRSGGTPLLMGNRGHLRDPVHPLARELKSLTSRAHKTDATRLDIARVEFLAHLYLDESGPCLTAELVLACLREGASVRHRGPLVKRGIEPLAPSASLIYDGPRDPDELWRTTLAAEGTFAARVKAKTYPQFVNWSASLPIRVDEAVYPHAQLQDDWQRAGRLGIGKSPSGRFSGSVTDRLGR